MTRRRFIQNMVMVGLGALAGAAIPVSALAATLDQAKASGQVGERPNGYLGVVADSPSPDVKALVDKVNAERRARYAEIAQKNGTSLAAVEALAGKKAIELTPSGQFVFVAGRGWVRKP
jgi:uncharacterized protein YdbL (DUF1318 family)